MAQETAVIDTGPSSVPEDTGAESVPTPSAETQQPESATATEQAATVEESWDDTYTRFKERDDFKAFLDREHKTKFREGHITGQRREAGQRGQIAQLLAQANQGITGINDVLREAQEQGTLDRKTLDDALRRYAPQLAKMPEWSDEVKDSTHMGGVKEGIKLFYTLLGKHPDIDDASLSERYLNRFEDEWEYDRGAEVFRDFMADAVKSAKEAAAKPLRTRIAKLEAALEEAKGGGRGGAGPGATVGSGGGSNKGTYAERLARGETLSPEEIDKMTRSLLS